MAETKPTNTVDWVASGATTEPAAGVKTSGYASGDKLPAQFMNWFWVLITSWLTWFNERIFDGATNADLTIKCPTTEAGDLKLEGGSSAAGTDQDGGDAELSGGSTTGTGGTTASLKAATAAASGAGVNTPEEYFKADGDNEYNKFVKPLNSALPSVAGAGVGAIVSTGQQSSSGAGGDGADLTGGVGTTSGGDGGTITGGAGSVDGGDGATITGGAGPTGGDGATITGGAGSVDGGDGATITGGASSGTGIVGGDGAVITGGGGDIGGKGIIVEAGSTTSGVGGSSGADITGGIGGSGNQVGGAGLEVTAGAGSGTGDEGKCIECDRVSGSGVDINLKPYSGAPSAPVEGDIWFDSSAAAGQKLKIYMDATTKYINVT